MFLKSIDVKGFKSFADKVELEMEKGITVVVGPNGSGKSNIADAVRWVLGEQSAKSLRGGKMEDVIFAGTDLRKPLGFAEVSITVDNADNMLPVDYSEVVITRRMYRSGESEYYMNKTACRLKDITELFMDTGVGKDGYSIIGQGRIDEILNAKPEDRREIFEEAAGIVKYKSRKQESEKRLGATEQNIIRLDDIINELENQLEPLSEQSSNARKYLDMRERLKVLELNIYIRNIDKIKEKIDSIRENYSNIENEIVENNRRNARIEDEYLKLKQMLQELDTQVEVLQNEVYSNNSELEKLQGQINVLNEKTLNIKSFIHRLDEEIKKEKGTSDRLNLVVDENNSKLSGINIVLGEQLTLLENKTSEFDSVNSRISEKEEFIENMKSEVIELLNLIADKKSSLNSYIAFRNNIEKRREQVDAEKGDLLINRVQLDDTLLKLQDEIQGHTRSFETAGEDLIRLDNEKVDIVNELKEIDTNIYELGGKIQNKQARYKILHEMETEFEGYNRSVKEIMKLKSSERDGESGICGVVADLVHVPEEYEVAIEVALGAALQNIVTENEVVAKNCIEFLKINKYGRATFLPLTTIKDKRAQLNDSVARNRGFIGVASELISYEGKYSNIINSLLGRVIVVNNMDNAIVIAKNTNYTMKIVTTEGDIINPGGAFTGGSISQKTGKILSRKRELEQLDKELNDYNNEMSLLNSSRSSIAEKLNTIEACIKDKVEEKHSIEIQISTCSNQINQIKADIERVNNSLSLLETELSQLEAEHNETCLRIEHESRELSLMESRNISISNELQTEQSGIKDILIYKEGLTTEITSLKVKVAEFRQEMSSIEGRIVELNSSIEESNIAVLAKAEERCKAVEEGEKVAADIKTVELLINGLTSKNSELKDKLSELINEKKNSNIILDDIEQKRRQCNEANALLQSEIHKLEIQKAKLDMELESLQNRIWDDYEISYAGALKYKTEIDNISQAVKDINSIKEEVKQLGTVNVGAIDEYKRVKDRYEFLLNQKRDLEEAKNSLQKVIVEMTEKMRAQFVKNFSVIKENFNLTFQQLFGGGRAELVLCDEENILESGVEIIAQPPGKKLQHLTLLSGGEKALTAIALLFGILKMKPSPFCILDEIEAALDDVNVARYARFLKEFSKETQFIVVTHRKGTMEVSDALYGVTMEEKGVSRIISVKLSEKAS